MNQALASLSPGQKKDSTRSQQNYCNQASAVPSALFKMCCGGLLATTLALPPGVQADDLTGALPPLALAAVASSKPSSIPAQLAELLRQGKVDAAYDLARANLEAEEGDPAFDFYYGLAASQHGKPEEASFAFERLVSEFPGNDRYRLEYARALYQIGRFDESDRQFRLVLDHHPPLNVARNVQLFLDRISAERSHRDKNFEFVADLGLGYDNNINNATSDHVVGLFELPDSAVQQESPFLSARLSGKYSIPFSQQNRMFVQLQTDSTHNTNTSEFDLDTASFTSAWVHQQGLTQFQLGGLYQHTWLDQQEYQRNSGIFMELRQLLGSAAAVTFYTGLFDKRSFELDELDALQPIATLQLQLFSAPLLHQFQIGVGTENPYDPNGKSLAKDFSFASYQLLWQANAKLQPYAAISTYKGDYKADNPVFGVPRNDLSMQYTLGLGSELGKGWRGLLETVVTDNRSNLDLYDYRRWVVQARIQYAY